MSKLVICARCYTTPEAPRTNFDHSLGRMDSDTWDQFCTEECLHKHQHAFKWEPIAETARVGLAFMNATMMMHMWMSIGRTDEPDFQVIQARRVLQCDQLQRLGAMDEVKAAVA